MSRHAFLCPLSFVLLFLLAGCGGESDFEVVCPDDAECGDLACGPDPVCGISCGTCDEGHFCDESGQCAVDLCWEVDCSEAPAPECIDGSTLREYEEPGTCVDGECEYEHEDIHCPHGCEGGQCLSDSCAGVDCSEAPAPECIDGSTLREYEEPGTCVDGECEYAYEDIHCSHGCEGGQCLSDSCAGVDCSEAPSPECIDGSTLREYEEPGTCVDGECEYAHEDIECSHGCEDAECLPPVPGWCIIESPKHIPDDGPGPTVYGQVWEPGWTPDEDAPILAQLGWGPDGVDPETEAGFDYVDAAFHQIDWNDNEYAADLPTDLAPGVYRYVYRFSLDGGLHWTYCDTTNSGANHGFDPSLLGTLVVSGLQRETIAFWDFHGQSADPTEGEGSLQRGEEQDDNIRVDGNPGWAWNVWRWHVDSFAEERFAEVEVSAAGHSDIVFSLDMNRTASGPRFFFVSYSVNDSGFTLIDDSPGERVFEEYEAFSWTLPADADDADTLRIRIHAFDEDAVWNGRLRMDNILVEGLAD